ncbi:MAG: stalk domain-containing protein [Eubacteriales bacterium]
MIQNNRISPADRRLKGAVNILRMNAAEKQRSVPNRQKPAPAQSVHMNRQKTAPAQSVYVPRSSVNQQALSYPRISGNASVNGQKNSNSGKYIPNNKNQTGSVKKNQKRVSVKQIKRKPTAEEIALQLRKREAYKRRQEIYKKNLRDYRYRLFKEWLRVFLCRLVVFAVMFVFFLLVSTIFFFVNLLNNGSPDTGVYTCQTGSIYDVVEVKTVKGNLMFRNGTYYINVTDIASYCEFTTTGDVTQIRFISKSQSNDNVRFKVGDAVIYVNGVRVRLTVPVIGEGDSIYVPVEFFNKYALGINVHIDEQERKITVSRSFDDVTASIISEFETENLYRQSKGENQKDVSELSVDIGYGDIAFTLRRNEPTEHIDEYTIGRDLLLITDPEYIANLKKLAEQAETQNTQAETQAE